jgi:hypothetical protein
MVAPPCQAGAPAAPPRTARPGPRLHHPTWLRKHAHTKLEMSFDYGSGGVDVDAPSPPPPAAALASPAAVLRQRVFFLIDRTACKSEEDPPQDMILCFHPAEVRTPRQRPVEPSFSLSLTHTHTRNYTQSERVSHARRFA